MKKFSIVIAGGGSQQTVLLPLRSGHIGVGGSLGGHGDGEALFIVFRIAAGRHDDTAGGTVGELHLSFCQRSVPAGLHDRQH